MLKVPSELEVVVEPEPSQTEPTEASTQTLALWT